MDSTDLVMCFGLKNVVASFQRSMKTVLQEFEAFSFAYTDDIVIFSTDWHLHLINLDSVLNKIDELGFTVRIDKLILRTVDGFM